jgi:hypothetical protein
MEVAEYTFVYKNKYMIHLIDTPGFDDTRRKDTEVLRDISTWLGNAYSADIFLSGIIYLHRISDVRLAGSARRNLHMFKKLIGEDCFRQVILATTMWEKVDKQTGEKREEELVTTPDFWGYMCDKGSKIMRHTHNDRESAMVILKHIIRMREEVVLAIQKEIIEDGLNLDETGAGRQINEDILALQGKHRKEIRELEKDMKDALRRKDQDSVASILELQKETKEKMEEIMKDRDTLRVDMAKLRAEQDRQIRAAQEHQAQFVRLMCEREQQLSALRLQADENDKAHAEEMVRLHAEIENMEKQRGAREKAVERVKNRGEMNLLSHLVGLRN